MKRQSHLNNGQKPIVLSLSHVYIESILNFIQLLCEKINSVTTHSFIAKLQAKYLARLKDDLNDDEVIVLGYFAENYSFVVQDEIQGFHWNVSQCSFHPVVLSRLNITVGHRTLSDDQRKMSDNFLKLAEILSGSIFL